MTTYDYPDSIYEIIGFYKEITYNGKRCGTVPCNEEKNRKWGYTGKQQETLVETITTSTKVVIPAGATVVTTYAPLCGKLKNKL